MISTDHIGSTFSLGPTPHKIVSLVPSITELLFDLGLAQNIVGRTKFCIHPKDGFTNAKVIGGTKQIHIDQIKALDPDLVIANKEENVKEQVEALAEFTSTFTTVVKNKEDAIRMIKDLGEITGSSQMADDMIKAILANFVSHQPTPKIKMVYLIWQDPYMTVGGDTFISNYMEDFGFENCFKNHNRYPSIGLSEMKEANPDYILLSSEPFPFKETHLKNISNQTGIPCILVDGSYCSWYGSRMLKSGEYLRHLSNKLA